MKIVFLQDDFPPQSFGGAGFSTYELARGMRELGHEVYVITACRTSAEAGESTYDDLTVFTIVSNYAPRWRAWRRWCHRRWQGSGEVCAPFVCHRFAIVSIAGHAALTRAGGRFDA